MGAARTFTEYEELASAAQRAYEVRRAGEAAEDVVVSEGRVGRVGRGASRAVTSRPSRT